MNKRRQITLLALPLLLGALIGGAKWKQLHPTATQRDLAERAHLRKAVLVNMSVDGKYVPIPLDEWKQILDDFYLMKSRDLNGTSWKKATIIARLDKDKSAPLGTVEISLDTHYSGYYSATTMSHSVALHPATERRLRELVAKYQSAR